ncbi:dipeptidase [Spongorhabdus nitratireducens]
MSKLYSISATVSAVCVVMILIFVPPLVEKARNKVAPHKPFVISEKAQKLHQNLLVGDLHADSLLWNRNLAERADYGHLDLPRLREGNVAIQAFTAVTKSPKGQNYHSNPDDVSDNITLLALVQAWPPNTWDSLLQRALYQAERLQQLAQKNPQQLKVIATRQDLEQVLASRAEGSQQIAGFLGTEGSHALEGKLENIQRLYDAGYRMMGLQHFFDNELGGSLHGESNAGLTRFGQQALQEMERLNIIVDLAHSSESVVRDVLAQAKRPVVISHTGIKGTCNSPRNISDQLMQQIAAKGGLIGIGFWDAVCDVSPEGIVRTLRYAIDLVGVEHVALGSDFDGSVTTALDASELAVLTQTMLQQGFTETEIRRVMGENLRDFLLQYLPQS